VSIFLYCSYSCASACVSVYVRGGVVMKGWRVTGRRRNSVSTLRSRPSFFFLLRALPHTPDVRVLLVFVLLFSAPNPPGESGEREEAQGGDFSADNVSAGGRVRVGKRRDEKRERKKREEGGGQMEREERRTSVAPRQTIEWACSTRHNRPNRARQQLKELPWKHQTREKTATA
jgi:hypothetical protein